MQCLFYSKGWSQGWIEKGGLGLQLWLHNIKVEREAQVESEWVHGEMLDFYMRFMSICHDKKKNHLKEKQIAFLTTPCNTPLCTHTCTRAFHTYTRTCAHMWAQSYGFSHTGYLSMPFSIIIDSIYVYIICMWATLMGVRYKIHWQVRSDPSPAARRARGKKAIKKGEKWME